MVTKFYVPKLQACKCCDRLLPESSYYGYSNVCTECADYVHQDEDKSAPEAA